VGFEKGGLMGIFPQGAGFKGDVAAMKHYMENKTKTFTSLL